MGPVNGACLYAHVWVQGKPTGNISIMLGAPDAAFINIIQPPAEGTLLGPHGSAVESAGMDVSMTNGTVQVQYQVPALNLRVVRILTDTSHRYHQFRPAQRCSSSSIDKLLTRTTAQRLHCVSVHSIMWRLVWMVPSLSQRRLLCW